MDICFFCQSFLQNKARSLTEREESAILHPRKQASTKQDKQPNDFVNDQSDDNEIETGKIAEVPKAEREITFISERIKSLPAVNPQHMSPRHFRHLHCDPSVDTRTKRACSDSHTQL